MNTEAKLSRTIVLGLGNPILGDDGIGCSVAEFIGDRLQENSGVTVLSTSVSPIRLIDEISGHHRLIIIDSITTGQAEPGELLEIEFRKQSAFPISAHHFSIEQLQDIGRSLGLPMPEYVKVYGIEITRPEVYESSISPALRDLLPELAEEIINRELTNYLVHNFNASPRGEFAV